MTGHRRAAVVSACAALVMLGRPTLSSCSAETEEGRQIYEHQCAICHKVGGIGAAILARRLGVVKSDLTVRTDLPGDYVRRTVRTGIGAMPYFTKVDLSDVQLSEVSEYLSGLTDQRQ